jgi:hypothetical protein
MAEMVTVECTKCCHVFEAKKGGMFDTEQLCAGCYLDTMDWYRCPDCRMVVSTRPCFICERNLNR